MSTVTISFVLEDKMSAPLSNMGRLAQSTNSQFEKLKNSSKTAFDSSSIGSSNDELEKTGGILGGLKEKLGKLSIAAAATTAAISFGKTAVAEGAKLEQSIGGVETLFKDSAETVKKNAQIAFRTAGISANEYMEQATMYSASLLQSLGGDTQKAAAAADMAIKDMSDNANKMGTDMGSIQNAYQGFSKQNYTMLDNLKLGYGGTKTEMQRLLKDAGKISKQKYDISNLSDVYNAIHVMQQELNITGTTAKEASSTFSGSMASMKAASKNLLGSMFTGQNLGQSVNALISSTMTFVGQNLIPGIGKIIMSVPKIITNFLPALSAMLKDVPKKLVDFMTRGGDEKIIANISRIISKLGNAIITNLPKITLAGIKIIIALSAAIIQAVPKIIAAAGKIVAELIAKLLLDIRSFNEKIARAIARLFSGAGEFLKDAGKELINGLWNGMLEGFGKLGGKVADAIQGIKNRITGKDGLDEHSPSKWGKQVGSYLTEGIGIGLMKEMPGLETKVTHVTDTTKQGFSQGISPREVQSIASSSPVANSSHSNSTINNRINFGGVTIREEADEDRFINKLALLLEEGLNMSGGVVADV